MDRAGRGGASQQLAERPGLRWDRRGAALLLGADLLPARGGTEKGHPAHLLEAALDDGDPGLDGDDGVRVAGGEDLLPQRGDALQLQLLALQGLHQLLGERRDRGTAGSQPRCCTACPAPQAPGSSLRVPGTPNLRVPGTPNLQASGYLRPQTSQLQGAWYPKPQF